MPEVIISGSLFLLALDIPAYLRFGNFPISPYSLSRFHGFDHHSDLE